MYIRRVARPGARRPAPPALLSSNGRIEKASAPLSTDQMRTVCAMALSRLDLSPRAAKGLAEAGIRRVADIVDWTERELFALRGFGPVSLCVLRTAIIQAAAMSGALAERCGDAAEYILPASSEASGLFSAELR